MGHDLGIGMSAIETSGEAGRASKLGSLLAHVVRPRPHRMSSGQVAIWALSAAMISTAALLFRAGAGDLPPIISSVHVPFWALFIAFAAAERFVVHVHFRRSAHSMSLGEIPLVFALVFAGGGSVILAGALGLSRGGCVPRGGGRREQDLPDRVGSGDLRHRGQLADRGPGHQRRGVGVRGPAQLPPGRSLAAH
jgi:hypothetical protein